MNFKNENQLRKLVRDCSQGPLYWVEPNLGSTDGLPDVFKLEAGTGRMVFMELKKGKLRGDDVLEYTVRPRQAEVLPGLATGGALGAVAVAQIGEAIVHVFGVEPPFSACGGKVEMTSFRTWTVSKPAFRGSIFGNPVQWIAWDKTAENVLWEFGIV